MASVSSSQQVLVVSCGGSTTIVPLPARGRLSIGRAEGNDVVVDHPSVSRKHAILHVGARHRIEDLGGQNGVRIKKLGARPTAAQETTLDMCETRVERLGTADIAPGDCIWLGSALLLIERQRDHSARGRVVADSKMCELYALAERVAGAPVNVLLIGETGTGKEVLAEAIHEASPRAKGPLVRVNCAALPESLAESELFGYERGAFTGASTRKQGFLSAADGGTLFLDEVGELPLALQAKLLRVLEDGRLTPLGAVESTRVDVRVVAATNRDLARAVECGEFRQDLYFRLDGFTLTIPPLRERVSEIEPLARHFLKLGAAKVGKTPPELAPEAVRKLEQHAWRGNVRELKNVVDRALVLCDDRLVRADQIVLGAAAAPRAGLEPGDAMALPEAVEQLERERLKAALERCAGNQTRAAELLGISRRTLVYRLDKYGLARPNKRLREE